MRKEIGNFMGITVYREIDERNRETIYLQTVGYREPIMFLAPGETFDQFVEGYRNLMMDPKERLLKAALSYVDAHERAESTESEYTALVDAVCKLRESK